MSTYPIPKNEQQRLKELYDYEVLDTISEVEYDSITKIAAQICQVPASLITFLDKDRQWFKSHLGIDINETPRAFSFCNYTIMEPDKVTVVPDLREDERFAANPLVTHQPNAVFYAGAPLVTPAGYVLGSICVLDSKVNNLSAEQLDALQGLAQQVVTRLELQKKINSLNIAQQELQSANKSLKNFAHLVSHDMKTPLANISMISRSFKKNYENSFDENANDCLDLIDRSAKELLVFVDDILAQSEMMNQGFEAGESVDSRAILEKVINLIAPPEDIEIRLTGKFPRVAMNKTSLQQVFQNLITNAIKYNDKQRGVIDISCLSNDGFHYFDVSDNGCGIAEQHLDIIFEQRQTLGVEDRYGNLGTGIGLATVQNILEANGGQVIVHSQQNIGSTFKISIPYRSN